MIYRHFTTYLRRYMSIDDFFQKQLSKLLFVKVVFDLESMVINIKVLSSSFDSVKHIDVFTIFKLLNERSQLICANDIIKGYL